MTTVHVVVPEGIDDPARPSGGNAYDRRICQGLRSLDFLVHEHHAAGPWPLPDTAASAALTAVVNHIPDGAVVLLDGLVACACPEALRSHSRRLHLAVLVHMPLGHRPANDSARPRERATLSFATTIVTTSNWARSRLAELYSLPSKRIFVAEPGVDAADLALGSPGGGELLCVAAVTPDKGHDLLLNALATIEDLRWHCVCVGSLDRNPAFVASLRWHGLKDRVSFTGPQSGAELARRYDAADVVVLASRAETYGMVVTEALARGLPVVAANVGGVPEALGHGDDGTLPGLLVPPDNAAAFGAALRAWLGDAELRDRLRRAARERRASLSDWSTTTSAIADVLVGASR